MGEARGFATASPGDEPQSEGGGRVSTERFPVEEGHILLFARAVGDTEPRLRRCGLRRDHRGGWRHRPADVRAVRRPVRPGLPAAARSRARRGSDRAATRRGQPAGRTVASGGGGGGGSGGGLHAEQEFHYHRPLRPGDVLSALRPARVSDGRSRAGPASWCSPSRSPSTGTRTANWSSPPGASASCTERPCRPGRPADGPAGRTRGGRRLTARLVLVDDLTRTQIVQYAGASGDFNPLHSDEVFATQVAGYPSVFAHGMLTMGMTGRVLTDWVGRRPPAALRRPLHQAGAGRATP